MSGEIVYLFDFHYLVVRAYYGLPDLRSRDGSPVGWALDLVFERDYVQLSVHRKNGGRAHMPPSEE